MQNEKKNDMHLHSADLLFFSTVKSCKSAVNFLQLNGIPAVTDQSIAETTECMKIWGASSNRRSFYGTGIGSKGQLNAE